MKTVSQADSKVNIFSKISIKVKLTLFSIVLTLVAVTATLAPALYLLGEYNSNIAREQVREGMKGLTITLNDYQQNALNFGAVMASHPGVIKAIKDKNADAVLQEISPLLKGANIDFATITDETGTVIVRTHEQKKGDSVVNQANIRNALAGTAFAAIESGTVVKFSARAGTPVRDEQGRIVGVISAGYYISDNKVVDKMKETFGTDVTLFYGKVRVATTITKDGQRVLGTEINEQIANKVLDQKQEYIGQADILGNQYITAYMPLLGPDNQAFGALFVGKNMDGLNAARNKVALIVGGISVVVLLLISLIAGIISKKITKPIQNLVTALEQVAAGDLTKYVAVTTYDEIGILANGYNKMIERLKFLIANVDSSVHTLNLASQTLTANEEQSVQAINQVASAIEEMASGIEQQRSSVEETSSAIEQIVTVLQQVAANTNDAASMANTATDAASQGRSVVDNAFNQMQAVEKSVASTAQSVAKLGERSSEIGSIINTISGIAGQTNLLALNAAIEAARAGEQGRGFAVVAEEVRKLAEQSQEASKRIAALISEIQSDTDNAVGAMNTTTREVKTGTDGVISAGKVFNNIAKLITEVSSQVSQIAVASQQISGGSQQIVISINDINQISTRAASQSQSISAAIEEQSAAMEELSVSSQSLTTMAQGLENAVTAFNI